MNRNRGFYIVLIFFIVILCVLFYIRSPNGFNKVQSSILQNTLCLVLDKDTVNLNNEKGNLSEDEKVVKDENKLIIPTNHPDIARSNIVSEKLLPKETIKSYFEDLWKVVIRK